MGSCTPYRDDERAVGRAVHGGAHLFASTTTVARSVAMTLPSCRFRPHQVSRRGT
jgi:hypothetical protein